MAEALVQAAARPRGDRMVGAAMLPLEPTFRLARPVVDLAMGRIVRGALANGRWPGDSVAIWEPPGTGAAAAGMHGRRSRLRQVAELLGR